MDATHSDRWTALIWAAEKNHLRTVEVKCCFESLLVTEWIATLNTMVHSVTTSFYKFPQQTLLCFSAKVLVSHGANVDATDSDGWTALMLAARNNHFQIAEVKCWLQI